MTNEMPERIWASPEREWSPRDIFKSGSEYLRADFHKAQVEALTSDRDMMQRQAVHGQEACDRLTKERDEARAEHAMELSFHDMTYKATCWSHTDEQRTGMLCPICLTAENKRLREALESALKECEGRNLDPGYKLHMAARIIADGLERVSTKPPLRRDLDDCATNVICPHCNFSDSYAGNEVRLNHLLECRNCFRRFYPRTDVFIPVTPNTPAK